MKTKSLWLLALGLAILCAWWIWSYYERVQPRSVIGLQAGSVVFSQSPLPALYWGEIYRFGDLGLKIKSPELIDLASINTEKTIRFNGVSYTQIQPGFFLVILDSQRIFLFTDPFDPAELSPSVALDFASDWTVLQRSSLLPESWLEPNQGWIVLGSQISDRLKNDSLVAKKPVVRPTNQGTVWLEKKPESPWQVSLP